MKLPRLRRHEADSDVPADLMDELREDADLGADRLAYYETCRKLYDGLLAPDGMTDEQKAILELAGFGSTENWIRPVVDKLAARVSLKAFTCPTSAEAEDWLQGTWWAENLGDRLAQVAVRETIKLGDGFIFHGYDDETGCATATWNPPDQVKVVVDPDTGRWLRVIKVWPSRLSRDAITRMNRYFPDRIEKWWAASEARGADWQRWELDDEPWPAPWTTTGTLATDDEGDEDGEPEAVGEPLGIPVTHLMNRPDGTSLYGHSEIDAAVPFQRFFSKQALDLFDVLDQLAHQIRWASGVDADGRRLLVRIGEWITSPNDQARFGALDGQDPSKVVDAMHSLLRRMAVATGTPLHGLDDAGTLPSGEALQTANLDLTAKARDLVIVLRDSFADGGRTALRIQEAFGDAPAWDGGRVIVDFEDVEVRNDLQEAQIAEVDHELGVSRRTLLARRGYDADAEARQRAREDADAVQRVRSIAPPPPDGAPDAGDDAAS